MKVRSIFPLLVLLLLSQGCSRVDSVFEVSNKKEVKLAEVEDVVRFDVLSSFGIGDSMIYLKDGQWPEEMIVRLSLKGLEGFTVTVGAKTVALEKLEVKAYTKSGELFTGRHLLDKAGYYEVLIPQSMLNDDVSKVRIHWVDFYRN